MVTVHRAPRGWKAYLQQGVAWFPKGFVYDTAITTPVPCSLQHNTFHLDLGRTEPHQPVCITVTLNKIYPPHLLPPPTWPRVKESTYPRNPEVRTRGWIYGRLGWGLVGHDHSTLGKTVLHKLLMEKIELREGGFLLNLPTLPLLKIHTFLDTEHLCCIWVVDTASFHSGKVSNCPNLSTF